MKIRQSRIFEKSVRQLRKQEKITLDNQIKKIQDNPNIGKRKKGDLCGIYIHKFKIKTTQYLLSYRFFENNVELIMMGPHENYYKDLKTYLKSRKQD